MSLSTGKIHILKDSHNTYCGQRNLDVYAIPREEVTRGRLTCPLICKNCRSSYRRLVAPSGWDVAEPGPEQEVRQ